MVTKKENVLVDINVAGLILFLRRVYLEGKMKAGCVIELEDGIGSVRAMDIDGSVFVSCVSKIAEGFVGHWDLGIGNLDLMIKFLATVEEDTVKMKLYKNRLILRRPKHGSLRYLLTDVELVPTVVEDSGTGKQLVDQCQCSLPLIESVRDDTVKYIGMLGATEVLLSFKGQKVTLMGGSETDHQYSLMMGKAECPKSVDDFHLRFHGDSLIKVFNILEYGEKKKLPVLLFAEDKPIVIQQDKKNLWALLHSEE